MPNLSTTAFETDFRKRLKPLTKKLHRIENKIQASVIKSMQGATKSTAYWITARNDLNKLYAEMVTAFDGWAKEEIPARYRRSLAAIQRRINATKAITANAQRSITSMLASS